jgi:hypothetical protein
VVGYGAVTALQHVSPGGSSDNATSAAARATDYAGSGVAGQAVDPESLPKLTTRTLPQFARSLASAHTTDSLVPPGTSTAAPMNSGKNPELQRQGWYTVSRGCTPGVPRAHVRVVQAEWKGARATIAVNPTTRHVSVYACGRPLRRLYSTSY